VLEIRRVREHRDTGATGDVDECGTWQGSSAMCTYRCHCIFEVCENCGLRLLSATIIVKRRVRGCLHAFLHLSRTVIASSWPQLMW